MKKSYHRIEALETEKIAPDIIFLNSIDAHQYLQKNLLLDLQGKVDLMDSPNHVKGLEALTVTDGVFYGVPFMIAYPGFSVNEALFQKLNLPIPAVEWSYQEYYDLAMAVAQKQKESDEEFYLLYSERMEYEFANFNLGIDVSNGYLPMESAV